LRTRAGVSEEGTKKFKSLRKMQKTLDNGRPR
jgi:hypothetical protein